MAVDADFVRTVLDDGLIPVVSSVARGEDGATYNINADTAAAELAVELGARKLVMLTDVPGVYANWPDTTEIISQITAEQLRAMVPTLSEGMIPKLTACLAAVDGGVERGSRSRRSGAARAAARGLHRRRCRHAGRRTTMHVNTRT